MSTKMTDHITRQIEPVKTPVDALVKLDFIDCVICCPEPCCPFHTNVCIFQW